MYSNAKMFHKYYNTFVLHTKSVSHCKSIVELFLSFVLQIYATPPLPLFITSRYVHSTKLARGVDASFTIIV